MADEKTVNKVTSHLTEDEKQQLYKNARFSDNYNDIWQNVGKCVFCDLKKKYILHEENGVVLTINIYPYIDGQLMAIPRRHVKSTNELTPLEWETMRKFSYIAKKLFKKVHSHKAMWSLVKTGLEAQGTVADHLHMHFIPFDTPDLSVWNYRKLEFTPLENVQKYKNEVKEFIDAYEKFDRKYSVQDSKKVVVDLLIIHDNKVLLQERKEEFKFDPDILTFPGGHLENDDEDLIQTLKREVSEEIHYNFEEKDVELISSHLSYLRHKVEIFDNHFTRKENQFIRNTYLLKNFDTTQKIKADDDCTQIVWVKLKDVKDHPKISIDSKKIILKTARKLISN